MGESATHPLAFMPFRVRLAARPPLSLVLSTSPVQAIGPGLRPPRFARLMRVSIKTLQNWEQHRRNPTGPAAALLKIVLTAPDVALKSLHT